jgi:DNA polymerase-3 subunit gamma/tau
LLDNIIGQGETVHSLKEELAKDRLPRTLLFHGPIYGGKLCPCASCEQQRQLSHPYTLILGSRYFDVEIPACADVYKRTGKTAARYLFVRSVRKLMKRFYPVLWQEGARRAAAVADHLNEIEDMIAETMDAERIERIVALSLKLPAYLPGDSTPVHQIRSISYWAHLSSPSERKVVIFENADQMQASSRNALLKLLEEPPENVYLFLLTTRKGSIMPTLRSRLRPYPFLERSEDEQKEVLRKIFREESDEYRSLRDYFLAWRSINPHSLKNLAKKFLRLVTTEEGGSASLLDEMAEIVSGPSAEISLTSLAEELLVLFQDSLREKSLPLELLESWTALLRDMLLRRESINLNPRMAVESLFYRMRRAL